jgi:cyclopropane fatty-acyl-phospholipid synthase-like methyltransferase
MRLEVLCGGGRAREGDIATGHMLPRFRSLDAVYAQRWSEVENFLDGRPAYGVTLHQWSELVDDPATVVPRWYGDATD